MKKNKQSTSFFYEPHKMTDKIIKTIINQTKTSIITHTRKKLFTKTNPHRLHNFYSRSFTKYDRTGSAHYTRRINKNYLGHYEKSAFRENARVGRKAQLSPARPSVKSGRIDKSHR